MSTLSPSPSVVQPLSTSERIQYIDVLRGFALYGVLLANLVWMACDIVRTPAAAAQLTTHSLDTAAKYFVVFFIDGKFITLFSFLFAVGFTVQIGRAEQRGTRGTVLYARRVTVLMAIGALHVAFLWFGDILLIYALLGFVLLLVRNWRPGPMMLLSACVLILFARVTLTRGAGRAQPRSVAPNGNLRPTGRTTTEDPRSVPRPLRDRRARKCFYFLERTVRGRTHLRAAAADLWEIPAGIICRQGAIYSQHSPLCVDAAPSGPLAASCGRDWQRG
jgi:hypothetical protein